MKTSKDIRKIFRGHLERKNDCSIFCEDSLVILDVLTFGLCASDTQRRAKRGDLAVPQRLLGRRFWRCFDSAEGVFLKADSLPHVGMVKRHSCDDMRYLFRDMFDMPRTCLRSSHMTSFIPYYYSQSINALRSQPVVNFPASGHAMARYLS